LLPRADKTRENIKMAEKVTGQKSVKWINPAQDRDEWCVLVKTVMNIRVP
jgi:hypothetical protein